MNALPYRLIERFLSSTDAEVVIGDLTERDVRGSRLWREAAVAIWHLRPHTPPRVDVMASFLSDLRHAARLLGRAPTFAVTVILTLGIAIGATTAIFSVANPVLIEALPYRNPNRLMMVWERDRDGGKDNLGFQTVRDYTDRATTLERTAAIGGWQPTLSEGDDPERLTGLRVSATYFGTLGVTPLLGRDFRTDEDHENVPRVVILSYGFWQRRFGGDASIIGKAISLSGTKMEVVGIMPADFDDVLSPGTQIWRVLGYDVTDAFACRTCHHLRMLARLKPGVDAEQAQRELTSIHEQLVAEHPKEYASVGALVRPLKLEVTEPFRPALFALSAAVLIMLIIAIANVANLQLARLVRREEELAIRTALGASAPRLRRQLLTEALLVAVLGGVAGVAIAWVTVPALVRRLPSGLPRVDAIHVDASALSIVGGIVLVLTIVVGLVPRRGRRTANIADTLRAGRRLTGTRHSAIRAGLVVTEIALALMLLVGAGLLARSITRLLDVDTGFDATNLLTLEINSVGAKYPDNASVWAFHDRVREAVRTLPGVVSVGVANQLPLGGNMDMFGVTAQDKPTANPEMVPSGDRFVVSADYLQTMRIPMVAGRAFTRDDERDTTNLVALVSQSLATKIWGGESPLGKRIRMGGDQQAWRTVIGVTKDVHHQGLDASATMQFYVPERQWFFSDNQEILVVRTNNAPLASAAAVRRTVHDIDPTQPIVGLASMDQVIASSTGQRRLALVLFAGFAMAALLLSVAGIYGVLAGNVAERTREIGLRSALGATPARILGLIVGDGARLAAVGLGLGVLGALALTTSLRAMLFGIGPHDPITLVAATLFLLATTLVACLVPAVRAVRVDPSQAFRSE